MVSYKRKLLLAGVHIFSKLQFQSLVVLRSDDDLHVPVHVIMLNNSALLYL